MSGGSLAGGDYYSLPNVEWVQYFHGDYALPRRTGTTTSANP
ncbi:MAG: hypothetical protein R2856_00190 [Caldilineaceae bacterium]